VGNVGRAYFVFLILLSPKPIKINPVLHFYGIMPIRESVSDYPAAKQRLNLYKINLREKLFKIYIQ